MKAMTPVDALGNIFRRRWIAIGRIKSDLAADAPPGGAAFHRQRP
jgi:hypothetical protein